MIRRKGYNQSPFQGGKMVAGVLVAGIFFAAVFAARSLAAQSQGGSATPPGVQTPNPFPYGPPKMHFPKRTEKQKEALLKYNYKKMKKHADQLAELAQSLQKKIDETNANVMSLEVIQKAEAIEKLAKKIKNEAKMD